MPKKIVYEAKDALFEVDRDTGILFFTWNGEVSEKSAKNVLSRAAGASTLMDQVNWLIDRRNLIGYSAEARIWIKTHFLDDIGLSLIEKTKKIAALNSDNPIAEVSAGVLLEALTTINPKIEHQKFNMPIPAVDWLQGIERPKEEPVKKKKRLFGKRR